MPTPLQPLLQRLVASFLEPFLDIDSHSLVLKILSGQITIGEVSLRKEFIQGLLSFVDVREAVAKEVSVTIPWSSLTTLPVEVTVGSILIDVGAMRVEEFQPSINTRDAEEAIKRGMVEQFELAFLPESDSEFFGRLRALRWYVLSNLRLEIGDVTFVADLLQSSVHISLGKMSFQPTVEDESHRSLVFGPISIKHICEETTVNVLDDLLVSGEFDFSDLITNHKADGQINFGCVNAFVSIELLEHIMMALKGTTQMYHMQKAAISRPDCSVFDDPLAWFRFAVDLVITKHKHAKLSLWSEADSSIEQRRFREKYARIYRKAVNNGGIDSLNFLDRRRLRLMEENLTGKNIIGLRLWTRLRLRKNAQERFGSEPSTLRRLMAHVIESPIRFIRSSLSGLALSAGISFLNLPSHSSDDFHLRTVFKLPEVSLHCNLTGSGLEDILPATELGISFSNFSGFYTLSSEGFRFSSSIGGVSTTPYDFIHSGTSAPLVHAVFQQIDGSRVSSVDIGHLKIRLHPQVFSVASHFAGSSNHVRLTRDQYELALVGEIDRLMKMAFDYFNSHITSHFLTLSRKLFFSIGSLYITIGVFQVRLSTLRADSLPVSGIDLNFNLSVCELSHHGCKPLTILEPTTALVELRTKTKTATDVPFVTVRVNFGGLHLHTNPPQLKLLLHLIAALTGDDPFVSSPSVPQSPSLTLLAFSRVPSKCQAVLQRFVALALLFGVGNIFVFVHSSSPISTDVCNYQQLAPPDADMCPPFTPARYADFCEVTLFDIFVRVESRVIGVAVNVDVDDIRVVRHTTRCARQARWSSLRDRILRAISNPAGVDEGVVVELESLVPLVRISRRGPRSCDPVPTHPLLSEKLPIIPFFRQKHDATREYGFILRVFTGGIDKTTHVRIGGACLDLFALFDVIDARTAVILQCLPRCWVDFAADTSKEELTSAEPSSLKVVIELESARVCVPSFPSQVGNADNDRISVFLDGIELQYSSDSTMSSLSLSLLDIGALSGGLKPVVETGRSPFNLVRESLEDFSSVDIHIESFSYFFDIFRLWDLISLIKFPMLFATLFPPDSDLSVNEFVPSQISVYGSDICFIDDGSLRAAGLDGSLQLQFCCESFLFVLKSLSQSESQFLVSFPSFQIALKSDSEPLLSVSDLEFGVTTCMAGRDIGLHIDDVLLSLTTHKIVSSLSLGVYLSLFHRLHFSTALSTGHSSNDGPSESCERGIFVEIVRIRLLFADIPGAHFLSVDFATFFQAQLEPNIQCCLCLSNCEAFDLTCQHPLTSSKYNTDVFARNFYCSIDVRDEFNVNFVLFPLSISLSPFVLSRLIGMSSAILYLFQETSPPETVLSGGSVLHGQLHVLSNLISSAISLNLNANILGLQLCFSEDRSVFLNSGPFLFFETCASVHVSGSRIAPPIIHILLDNINVGTIGHKEQGAARRSLWLADATGRYLQRIRGLADLTSVYINQLVDDSSSDIREMFPGVAKEIQHFEAQLYPPKIEVYSSFELGNFHFSMNFEDIALLIKTIDFQFSFPLSISLLYDQLNRCQLNACFVDLSSLRCIRRRQVQASFALTAAHVMERLYPTARAQQLLLRNSVRHRFQVAVVDADLSLSLVCDGRSLPLFKIPFAIELEVGMFCGGIFVESEVVVSFLQYDPSNGFWDPVLEPCTISLLLAQRDRFPSVEQRLLDLHAAVFSSRSVCDIAPMELGWPVSLLSSHQALGDQAILSDQSDSSAVERDLRIACIVNLLTLNITPRLSRSVLRVLRFLQHTETLDSPSICFAHPTPLASSLVVCNSLPFPICVEVSFIGSTGSSVTSTVESFGGRCETEYVSRTLLRISLSCDLGNIVQIPLVNGFSYYPFSLSAERKGLNRDVSERSMFHHNLGCLLTSSRRKVAIEVLPTVSGLSVNLRSLCRVRNHTSFRVSIQMSCFLPDESVTSFHHDLDSMDQLCLPPVFESLRWEFLLHSLIADGVRCASRFNSLLFDTANDIPQHFPVICHHPNGQRIVLVAALIIVPVCKLFSDVILEIAPMLTVSVHLPSAHAGVAMLYQASHPDACDAVPSQTESLATVFSDAVPAPIHSFDVELPLFVYITMKSLFLDQISQTCIYHPTDSSQVSSAIFFRDNRSLGIVRLEILSELPQFLLDIKNIKTCPSVFQRVYIYPRFFFFNKVPRRFWLGRIVGSDNSQQFISRVREGPLRVDSLIATVDNASCSNLSPLDLEPDECTIFSSASGDDVLISISAEECFGFPPEWCEAIPISTNGVHRVHIPSNSSGFGVGASLGVKVKPVRGQPLSLFIRQIEIYPLYLVNNKTSVPLSFCIQDAINPDQTVSQYCSAGGVMDLDVPFSSPLMSIEATSSTKLLQSSFFELSVPKSVQVSLRPADRCELEATSTVFLTVTIYFQSARTIVSIAESDSSFVVVNKLKCRVVFYQEGFTSAKYRTVVSALGTVHSSLISVLHPPILVFDLGMGVSVCVNTEEPDFSWQGFLPGIGNVECRTQVLEDSTVVSINPLSHQAAVSSTGWRNPTFHDVVQLFTGQKPFWELHSTTSQCQNRLFLNARIPIIQLSLFSSLPSELLVTSILGSRLTIENVLGFREIEFGIYRFQIDNCEPDPVHRVVFAPNYPCQGEVLYSADHIETTLDLISPEAQSRIGVQSDIIRNSHHFYVYGLERTDIVRLRYFTLLLLNIQSSVLRVSSSLFSEILNFPSVFLYGQLARALSDLESEDIDVLPIHDEPISPPCKLYFDRVAISPFLLYLTYEADLDVSFAQDQLSLYSKYLCGFLPAFCMFLQPSTPSIAYEMVSSFDAFFHSVVGAPLRFPTFTLIKERIELSTLGSNLSQFYKTVLTDQIWTIVGSVELLGNFSNVFNPHEDRKAIGLVDGADSEKDMEPSDEMDADRMDSRRRKLLTAPSKCVHVYRPQAQRIAGDAAGIICVPLGSIFSAAGRGLVSVSRDIEHLRAVKRRRRSPPLTSAAAGEQAWLEFTQGLERCGYRLFHEGSVLSILCQPLGGLLLAIGTLFTGWHAAAGKKKRIERIRPPRAVRSGDPISLFQVKDCFVQDAMRCLDVRLICDSLIASFSVNDGQCLFVTNNHFVLCDVSLEENEIDVIIAKNIIDINSISHIFLSKDSCTLTIGYFLCKDFTSSTPILESCKMELPCSSLEIREELYSDLQLYLSQGNLLAITM